MPLSRKTLKRTMIVFNSEEKKLLTGYATFAEEHGANHITEDDLPDIEIEELIEIKYTLDDIEKQLQEAIGSGHKISVKYYKLNGFETATGYVEGIDQDSRKVSMVYYDQRWEIMLFNIVDIELK